MIQRAHAELGLEYPSTAARIRAAYLREVKVRKPDKDPEGFRRLRAAYEQLQSWCAAGAPARDPNHEYALRPTAPDAARPSSVEDSPAEQTPASDVAATSQPSFDEPVVVTVKRRLSAQLAGMPSGNFRALDRIKLIDAAHRQHSDDSELSQWLAGALLDEGFESEAVEVLETFLRKHHDEAPALGVFRFSVGRIGRALPPGVLRLAPLTLGVATLLRSVALLLEPHRDNDGAAELLHRMLLQLSEVELRPHSKQISRLILLLAHAGFRSRAQSLIRVHFDGLEEDLVLLREWALFSERVASGIADQVAWELARWFDGSPSPKPPNVAITIWPDVCKTFDEVAPHVRDLLRVPPSPPKPPENREAATKESAGLPHSRSSPPPARNAAAPKRPKFDNGFPTLERVSPSRATRPPRGVPSIARRLGFRIFFPALIFVITLLFLLSRCR